MQSETPLPLLEWQYRRRNLFQAALIIAAAIVTTPFFATLNEAPVRATRIVRIGPQFDECRILRSIENSMFNTNIGTLVEWRFRRQNLLIAAKPAAPAEAIQYSEKVHRNVFQINNDGDQQINSCCSRSSLISFRMDAMREALQEINIGNP